MQDKSTKTKNTNPLYVVTNNGTQVEEAKNFLDLWIKKLGLEDSIQMLSNILEMLLKSVETYPMFLEVKKVMDQLLEKLINFIFTIQNLALKKA
jgi:hypothetical protein